MLVEHTHKLLAKHLSQVQNEPSGNDAANVDQEHLLSFEECSDITTRMVWCKPRKTPTGAEPSSDGLPTVHEQDEAEARNPPSAGKTRMTTIPLKSCQSPTSLELPFDALAEPCEDIFFDPQRPHCSFDDHELPLHLLVYHSLVRLPLDVRALCMSRIIFTGGCSSVLGLRGRIFDEVSRLISERGWDPVQGRAVERLRSNPKLKRKGARQAADSPAGTPLQQLGGSEGEDGVWHDAANTVPEIDPIEEQLKRGTDQRPRVQGELRAIESLGPWSGASLVTHLKAPAIATIDREIWQQHGAAGASRASDVDHRTQRQSLGPGGLIRGSATGSAWTLGVWGAI